MPPVARTVGRVLISVALVTMVMLAHRANYIGLLFTTLFTIASIAFAWPWFAHKLGQFNTGLLLSLVYFFAAGPMRMFNVGRKPSTGPSHWYPKKPHDPALPERRRMHWQF